MDQKVFVHYEFIWTVPVRELLLGSCNKFLSEYVCLLNLTPVFVRNTDTHTDTPKYSERHKE